MSNRIPVKVLTEIDGVVYDSNHAQSFTIGTKPTCSGLIEMSWVGTPRAVSSCQPFQRARYYSPNRESEYFRAVELSP